MLINIAGEFSGTGVFRKPKDENNWQYSDHKTCKATVEKALPAKKSIKNKMPKIIYKQPCGNCTSNAVLAADAYYYHDPNGVWRPSTIFTYYNQRVMDGQSVKVDCGSCVQTALDAVRKYGACNAHVWPNNKPFSRKPSKAAYKDGLKGHEVTKYYEVLTPLQIKKALNSGYPVVAAVGWVFNCIDANTWVLSVMGKEPTKQEAEECHSGHAIVFVGYDDEKQLFEFRNSWGEQWGNHGYGYLTYESVKNCVWFEDSYAVIK